MRNQIITLGREYGSGGRFIGKMVADELGIPFYDKEIIALVAQKSGYAIEFIEETGEYSSSNSLLYNIALSGAYMHSMFAQPQLSVADKVNIIQGTVIKEIADKGPCVIIGRCADYILREREDILNTFIYADMEEKKKRAIEHFHIDAEHVEKELVKKDKARANHYKRYTGQDWAQAKNYHLCLDSGKLSLELCKELIILAFKG